MKVNSEMKKMAKDISTLSRKILRELCTNSRASLSALERKLSVPRYLISRHIRRMEEELGLRYTLEIDSAKLGLSKTNVLHFRFSRKPDIATVKAASESSGAVQLSMTTKGKDFGLVMFVTPRDTEEYAKWEISLFLKFAKYGVAPSVSYIDIMHLGFLPLNDWAINSSQLKDAYKKILVELSKDSRQSIRNLSRKIGLKEDLTRYYLIKLENDGVIRKFTTIITKPTLKTNMLLFVNYTFREGYVNRVLNKRLSAYFRKEAPLPVCNEYQMVASMSGGEYDLVWGIYSTEEEARRVCIGTHKSIFQKDLPSVRYGYVDDVVKGHMPLRSIEIKENYVTTTWTED